MEDKYNHKKVEKKWQEKWAKDGLYTPSIKSAKKPYYNLYMFPYPSAEGLHAGHAFSSTGSDIYGRFIRMQGKDVFQPIGYDSFGIHSENYAITTNEHPEKMLSRTTKYYEKQMRMLGHGYDWTRTVTTSDIDYYKWTQWLFVEMFKAGLAYRQKASVNWCPSCKTVLADEQVISEHCERCGTKVEIKELEQWFFRITDYADKLLDNLEKIDWSQRVVIAQRNWIGRSTGAIIKFKVSGKKVYIESFTTRPDTLYGATFFVVSPEHPHLINITTSKYKKEVQEYVKKAKAKSKQDRVLGKGEKTGVFTGSYVVNPATDKKIPIYVADYVLMDYGTGSIMGVPAHDGRDWEFAKKYKLDIVEVIKGGDVDKEAYVGPGSLVNSGSWNGIKVPEDISKVVKYVEEKGWGKAETKYHLRDWLISRQRYWGPPIPMIHCVSCAKEGVSWFTKNKGNLIQNDQADWDHAGWYPAEIPVELPTIKEYKPEGKGRGPLEDHPEFYEVKCPSCGGDAKRETDVSDTFLDSSWYFLRYPSVDADSSTKLPFDPTVTKKWLPVDLYFGGAEHSVLHLMYARFTTMVLNDLGHIDFEEPFPKFFAHGLMIKDGAKMSKSRGNVVNPDEYVEKYGADALRLYLVFIGPMDQSPDFRDAGMEGMYRFLMRVRDLYQNHSDLVLEDIKDAEEVLTIIHQTIRKVSKDMQNFKYNTAISSIMEFVNHLKAKTNVKYRKAKGNIKCAEWEEALTVLAKLLAPFAPHITEELWTTTLGREFSIHTADWPEFNPTMIKENMVNIIIQVNGKLRGQMSVDTKKAEDKGYIEAKAKKDDKVVKHLTEKKIINTIFVPGKIINFVTE